MKISAVIGLLCVCLSGCSRSAVPQSGATTAPGTATVLMNVTSDARDSDRLQAVDMAMKLAGFALDEGRTVAMFFNVKGVHIPTGSFPADIKYQDNLPVSQQLAKLIERGAQVHVCPICMKALGVKEADVIKGAQVTTRAALFAHIGTDTAVFTY